MRGESVVHTLETSVIKKIVESMKDFLKMEDISTLILEQSGDGKLFTFDKVHGTTDPHCVINLYLREHDVGTVKKVDMNLVTLVCGLWGLKGIL